MGLFGKPRAGGFMDQIRCDEPSYLIWKWHPNGSVSGNNNRENYSLGFISASKRWRSSSICLQSKRWHNSRLYSRSC